MTEEYVICDHAHIISLSLPLSAIHKWPVVAKHVFRYYPDCIMSALTIVNYVIGSVKLISPAQLESSDDGDYMGVLV